MIWRLNDDINRCPTVANLDARRNHLPRMKKKGFLSLSFFILSLSLSFPPNKGLRAYSHLIIVTISTLNLFSGNSVFLQWQDWLGSWFDCSHLGVPRRRKHWHLTHVKKGGMDVKNCPCLWSCSCHRPLSMNFFTMIWFQSNLEYNTYRMDKTGKKINWKLWTFYKSHHSLQAR